MLDQIIIGIDFIKVDIGDAPEKREAPGIELLKRLVAGRRAKARLPGDLPAAPFGAAFPEEAQDQRLGLLVEHGKS